LDLLFRDITPEDYDTLLRLDENNVKNNIASEDSLEKLPVLSGKEHIGEECTVCMSSFEKDDEVTELPCRHRFHRSCISKWLAECKQSCPNCGSSLQSLTSS
jgi:E3 ubiquitin-protein ligase ZSWIM2